MRTAAQPLSHGVGVADRLPVSAAHARESLDTTLLETEARFYRAYPWCLNAFPTLREVVQHLRDEVRGLDDVDADWQHAERMTNAFLLSCAITDTVDDYLVGQRFDFSKATTVVPGLGPGVRVAEGLLKAFQRARERQLGHLRKWRQAWGASVEAFLKVVVADGRPDRTALARAGAQLTTLLDGNLPDEVQRRRPRIPAAFRTRDLTHFDILALGRQFIAAFPTRERPLLVIGLRTAGSYFAPLLCALLRVAGYQHLEAATIRPKKGLSRWEAETLARNAKNGALAVIVDEPPQSGATLAKGIDLVRRAGFAMGGIVALLPINQAWRDWRTRREALSLLGIRVVQLEPEQWHKRQLLEMQAVEARVAEYFGHRTPARIRVVASPTADRLNLDLDQPESRLKRIYEVRLEHDDGPTETRYIIAKSVGWGWLGYHALIAGERLASFVPPLLGLRDGILYSEWLVQGAREAAQDRGQWLETLSSYIAARVRRLNLQIDPAPDLSRTGQHRGYELLAGTLARVYGWKPAVELKRARFQRELAHHTCPAPTLIDGRMRPQEWIAGPGSMLKTDFEHHGQGKHELNMTDPAYDLAEAILYFGLSDREEEWLIHRYIEQSGDAAVSERLFLNKLLAGTWAMHVALSNLADLSLRNRAPEFNRLYIDAWNFLITQTVRLCGRLCERPAALRWQSPIVVMDIDGVLDKGVIGFPSTSAAGLQAVCLLHAHDIAVTVNTARTLAEVQEYCRAYGFVGGVAEYGAIAWDAISGQERVVVSPGSLHELERVRNALRQAPGVFLNDDYRYSIRAYTYERDATVPLPTLFIRDLLASLKADGLTFLQTHMDTAIVAREVDKGKGLLALLQLVDQRDSETIAIGDSEPDLAMFRVANRSFAPSHISCRSVARLLGCTIASRPYQAGLLRSTRLILHPDGGQCDRCRDAAQLRVAEASPLFWEVLEAADRAPLRLLLRALLDPMALRAFAR